MGYRSNVALGIAFVNRAAAREFVLKMQACQPEDMRQALTEYSVVLGASEQEPVMFLAHFECVKWYPSYPDVIAHDGLRSLAEEAGATTRFVRLGEDIGDDEDDTNYSVDNTGLPGALQDAIQVRRTVECDIPPGSGIPIGLI